MNISAEKQEIIRRFNLVHDIDLIKAIKSLLDFGLHKQHEEEEEDNMELNKAIEKAISQSQQGLGRPHEEVMADLRKRYKL